MNCHLRELCYPHAEGSYDFISVVEKKMFDFRRSGRSLSQKEKKILIGLGFTLVSVICFPGLDGAFGAVAGAMYVRRQLLKSEGPTS
jgi:hypothetical protein